MKHAIITILLCALATGAQAQEAKTFLKPDGLLNSPGYSQAVEITKGKLVILAGQMPVDDKGQLVGGGDFKAQATRFPEYRAGAEGRGPRHLRLFHRR